MVDDAARDNRRERRRGQTGEAGSGSSRQPNYRSLKNPFLPQPVFSDDQVAAIHETALRVLEELGIKVLLPEARAIYARAGALVDEDSQMVRIGRDIVDGRTGLGAEVDPGAGRRPQPRPHARTRLAWPSSPGPARPTSPISIAAAGRERSPTSRN